MWIMVLFILNLSGEVVNAIQLVGPGIPDFKSFEECTIEETRLMGELKKAYPKESDYMVKCVFDKKKRITA